MTEKNLLVMAEGVSIYRLPRGMVDPSVEFHALLLETSELTQPCCAAWIGIRLLLNVRFRRKAHAHELERYAP
jgi:hypothetical protein